MSIWSSKDFVCWDESESDAFYLSLDKAISRENVDRIPLLKNLEYLKIFCYIGKSLPVNFATLRNLISLTITPNNKNDSLDTFPSEICQLTKLQNLSISGHQFTSVDPLVGNLQELRFLDLSCNLICDIPESFASLKRLQTFNLSNNVHIDIDIILKIESLYSLNLSDVYNITGGADGQLPESLCEFKYGDSLSNSLKETWIGRNPINYQTFQANALGQLLKEALQVMHEELENE